MNIIEGVVEKVFVNEPKEGKFGTYYPQVLKVNGLLLTKNSNTATPIASEGDTIKALYETRTSSQGKEFHNISGSKGAFEVVSTGGSTGQTVTTSPPKKPTITTVPSEADGVNQVLSKTTKTTITAKDRSIARQSSLKVAAELLLSDKSKETFDPEELKRLTLQLEEFVLAPYNQQG